MAFFFDPSEAHFPEISDDSNGGRETILTEFSRAAR